MQKIQLKGLNKLWSETKGSPKICIAILDGPVKMDHPCFVGANLSSQQCLIPNIPENGVKTGHGTHVTSIISGQHNSDIKGIAPLCRSLIIPIFSDNQKTALSQLDLARAINKAIAQGANIINISAGQLVHPNQADEILVKAVQACKDNNILIVAATGNNGSDEHHVPAALPSVLAVGAMDINEKHLAFSNWGKEYRKKGILAPGKDILGASLNGKTTFKTGTSCATPIVSGIAALLLSLQIKNGLKPDPYAIGNILLNSATACDVNKVNNCQPYLLGKLNIPKAHALSLNKKGVQSMSDTQTDHQMKNNKVDSVPTNEVVPSSNNNMSEISIEPQATQANEITPSACGCQSSANAYVYSIGTLGYDFSSEARRDTFRQQMPFDQYGMPGNPYDAKQLVEYLKANPSEAAFLTWTLNIELTPVYAIAPMGGAFDIDVYKKLITFLENHISPSSNDQHISRISIPGVLSNKPTRLFSGQIVPTIVPQARGMWGWKTQSLINAAKKSCDFNKEKSEEFDNQLKNFLERIYYELHNLGESSSDRALNYAATNVVQVASILKDGSDKYQLDRISVEKSKFCRMDSDCWDIKLIFFQTKSLVKPRKIYRFTIDVSDSLPVTVGKVKKWYSSS